MTSVRHSAACRLILDLTCAWLTVVITLSWTGPAMAGSLVVDEGRLVYAARAGEANALTVNIGGTTSDSVLVFDAAGIQAGSGCMPSVAGPSGPTLAGYYECFGVVAGALVQLGDANDQADIQVPNGGAIDASGGEGADRVFLQTSGGNTVVDGGPGADELQGGQSDDALRGGPGDDAIFGNAGADSVAGGSGDDVLGGDVKPFDDNGRWFEDTQDGGADTVDGDDGADRLYGGGSADVLRGGAGKDVADYSGRSNPVRVSLNGLADDGEGGEDDLLGTDIEDLMTGPGSDELVGDGRSNALSSGAGDDSIDGGAGSDEIDAGPGADRVQITDAAFDRALCGGGDDRIEADRGDLLDSCEAVTLAAQPFPDPCHPGAKADRRCTPGETRRRSRNTLCRGDNRRKAPAVTPVNVANVLRIYGLSSTAPYVVERLIPASLGGTSRIRNLWPRPKTDDSKARAKRAFEARILRRVCRRHLGLGAAQRAVARRWSAPHV